MTIRCGWKSWALWNDPKIRDKVPPIQLSPLLRTVHSSIVRKEDKRCKTVTFPNWTRSNQEYYLSSYFKSFNRIIFYRSRWARYLSWIVSEPWKIRIHIELLEKHIITPLQIRHVVIVLLFPLRSDPIGCIRIFSLFLTSLQTVKGWTIRKALRYIRYVFPQ